MTLNKFTYITQLSFKVLLVLIALKLQVAIAEVIDTVTTVNKVVPATTKPANENFGRLFTSQYERNGIDRARLTGGFIPAKVIGVDENTASISSPPPAQPIKVLGVLLRADGKNKVWLSGDTEAPENILNGRSIIGNINQSANVKVGINNGAILKPGQVWSPLAGRQESYQIPVPKPVVDTTAVIEDKPKLPAVSAQTSSAPTSAATSSEAQSSVSSSAK